ncbi:hypothetical protein CLOBOL_01069 [Enterocloster bolteae ATCC BAA-613]|uniref:Uncharacterized protein n=1 Tax=Enterocloster bolteae (strain ATCC BAA-613 / DSM 15670 / CCUG 46953 / JCM 12243 / WAL 16351) TaxID=411902 RepID=A8RJY4_ENTBW|nr:hypothetical protein CLOBOL_01069 [Enterocloster bolteae ATCC BAA-613]
MCRLQDVCAPERHLDLIYRQVYHRFEKKHNRNVDKIFKV